LQKRSITNIPPNQKNIGDREDNLIRYHVVNDEQGFHVRYMDNPYHIFTAFHEEDNSAELLANDVCDELNQAFFKGHQYALLKEMTRETSFDSPLLKIGDKIKVIKPIESKLSIWWKSMCSIWYEPNIQPKLGDEYEITGYEKTDKIYKGTHLLGEYQIKCLNRKLPVFDTDLNSIIFYVFWMDELIRRNKICKIK
jgi:hypothetical protein